MPTRSLGLFLFVFFVHAVTPVATQGDSRWTIPIALNLLHHQTFDLRSYSEEIVRHDFYGIECVFPGQRRLYPLKSISDCDGGRLYALYPASISILALPVVAPMETLLQAGYPLWKPWTDRVSIPVIRNFLAGDLRQATELAEKVVASVFTALAAVVMYRTALTWVTPSLALAHAFLFAFGTLAWSLVSRALWYHGPSILLNALAIWLLAREKLDRKSSIALGAVLTAAFFIRPTNAVPAALIGLLCLFRLRMPVWWLAAGIVPMSCVFLGINVAMYGQAISSYFRVNVPGVSTGAIHGMFLHGAYGEAILSNLISPARGLFVYMPFLLLLLIPSVWTRPVSPLFARQRPWFAAIFGLQLVLISGYSDWWGGFSYGPRYLSDVLPYLLYLWLPVWGWAVAVGARKMLVALTIAIAFFIHFRGATAIAVHHWNSTPVSVNQDPRRLWDWRDAPFFRGLH